MSATDIPTVEDEKTVQITDTESDQPQNEEHNADEPTEEPKTDEPKPEEPKIKEHQTNEDREARVVRYQVKTDEEPRPKLSCERLTINDSKDPSYTNLTLPYYVICRQRYAKAATRQRLQFLKEIRKQEISQSKALSGVRIHRVFINPVMTPPKAEEIIRLTPRQQFKLEQLLKE